MTFRQFWHQNFHPLAKIVGIRGKTGIFNPAPTPKWLSPSILPENSSAPNYAGLSDCETKSNTSGTNKGRRLDRRTTIEVWAYQRSRVWLSQTTVGLTASWLPILYRLGCHDVVLAKAANPEITLWRSVGTRRNSEFHAIIGVSDFSVFDFY